MKKKVSKTGYVHCYDRIIHSMQRISEPIYALALRMYIFCDMFRSGWLKVTDISNGQWERVVHLYQYEFQVPIIAPSIAAALSIFNEVVLSSLLLVGMCTRISSFALLFMAIIIEFTYIHHLQHYIWITMLTYLVIRGAGYVSIDCFIRKKLT